MSHQLVWYLLPNDFVEALERVERSVPVVAIADRADQPVPRVLPPPLGELVKAERATAFLVRPEDLHAVHFLAVPSQGYWVVDELVSPVIEITRPLANDDKDLRAGRLYYKSAFYDDAGAVERKPEEFLQWARAVFAAFKRGLKHDRKSHAWVGPVAREWQASTGGTFRSQ